MNSKLVFVLVFSTFFIPITSFAQTSGIIPIGFKHVGEVSIDNVKVDEKDYYNIVHLKLYMKVENLALEDGDSLNGAIILQNQNGKTYGGTICDYQYPQDYSHISEANFLGTEGGINKPTFCYNVEKEFSQFTVYLQQYSSSDASYHKYQIANIDLNQYQNPITNAGSYAQNLANNASSIAQNAVNNAGSYVNPTQASDFFTQFVNWFKSLFHLS